MKNALKESLRLNYVAGGNTYERGRDGQPIRSVEEYIQKLAEPVDGDLNRGPQVWPDASIIGNIIADILGLHVFLYVPMGDIYKLYGAFGHGPYDSIIQILYTNRDHFDILTHSQVQTDADAMEIEQRPKGTQSSATVGRRFLNAFKTLKGKLSVSSLKDGMRKFGKGMKESRKLLLSGQFQGEIIVAGERVRVDETGFIEAEFADITSFKNKYFPGVSGDDLGAAAATFSKIFHINYNKSAGNFLPPCDDDERSILMEGLTQRRGTLYHELMAIQAERGDAAILRTKLELYERLGILINELQGHIAAGRCTDYNPDGSPAGFKKVNLELEEEMRGLLRQFAFLVLQAKMEVPEYDHATEGAKEILTKLNQDKITKDEMNAYLLLWREQAAQQDVPQNIPHILAEVLDGVDAQPGLVALMVEDQLQSLYAEIIRIARLEYGVTMDGAEGPPAILIEFDNFVRALEEQSLDFRTKVTQLMLWIIRKNKDCWDTLGALQGSEEVRRRELGNRSTDLARIQRELAARADQLAECERRYRARMERNAENVTARAVSEEAREQLAAEFRAYQEANVRVMEAAQADLRCRGAQEAGRADLASLQERLRAAEADVARAREAALALERTVATQRESAAVLTRERDGLAERLRVLEDNTRGAQARLAAAQAPAPARSVAPLRGAPPPPPSRGGGGEEQEGGGPTEDIARLTQELAAAKAQQATCAENLRLLQVKLDTTVRDVKLQASQEVAAIKGEVDALKLSLAKSLKDIASRDECLQKAGTDVQKLMARLKECNRKNLDLTRELASARAQVSTDNERSVSQMSSLASQLQSARSEKEALLLEYSEQKRLQR